MTDAEYVRKTRANLGLNQTDFAKLLGVTNAAVCRWEKGNRKLAGAARILVDRMQGNRRRRK